LCSIAHCWSFIWQYTNRIRHLCRGNWFLGNLQWF
jgi:hypothetical protein